MGLSGAIAEKSHFMHKMLHVKGLFSIHSPDLLQCGEPRPRLDASLRLGVLLSWEIKDVQIHEPSWPWHFFWLIFVAIGLKLPPKNKFGREPNIGLIFKYFLPCRLSFPNSHEFHAWLIFFWKNIFSGTTTHPGSRTWTTTPRLAWGREGAGGAPTWGTEDTTTPGSSASRGAGTYKILKI